jgi:ATP-dependent protease Clp ATPase subunit
MRRTGQDEGLLCSFCHKSQHMVSKLISSPSDYPRAYICAECIAVCNRILEVPDDPVFAAVRRWILAEEEGRESGEALTALRKVAREAMGLDRV